MIKHIPLKQEEQLPLCSRGGAEQAADISQDFHLAGKMQDWDCPSTPRDTSDSKAVSESRLKLCRDDSGRICLGFMYPVLLIVYPHTVLCSLDLAELHSLPFPQTQKP